MENLKKCTGCNTEKNTTDFYKGRSRCKKCDSEKKKKFREENKEKVAKMNKEHYDRRRDAILKQKKEKYANNVDAFTMKNQKYHEQNRERILQRKKEYYQKNKEQIFARMKLKYNSDETYKTIASIRRRTRKFLRQNNKFSEFIGCSVEYLKKWFEFNFNEDANDKMTWENFGEWQIDHVFPLSKLKNMPENERSVYYSWRNLRPVPRTYNASKSGRIVRKDLDLIKGRLAAFEALNPLVVEIDDTIDELIDLDE